MSWRGRGGEGGHGKKLICKQIDGWWGWWGDFNGEWPVPDKPMFIRPSDYFVCMATFICCYYFGDFYKMYIV
jgi:hypothetical protein